MAGTERRLYEALCAIWARIRRDHPEVPDATVTIVTGRESGCTSIDWTNPVIMVGPAVLRRDPDDILGWLFHQAGHGIEKSSSVGSEGRYHSFGYAEAARKLGLDPPEKRVPGIGWSSAAVPLPVTENFAAELDELLAALQEYEPPRRVRNARPDISAVCSCPEPRRVRMSRSSWGVGQVLCAVCKKPFTVPDILS